MSERPESTFQGPAGWRIRWFIRTSLLLSLSFGGSACRELPNAGWTQLTNLRQEVFKTNVAEMLPDLQNSFETRFQLARDRYVAESAKWGILRDDPLILETELIYLCQEADYLIEEAARIRRDRLDRLELEVAAIEDLIDPAQSRSLVPRFRRKVTEAKLELDHVKYLLENGSLADAEAAINRLRKSSEDVRELLDRLDARFGDAENIRNWNQLCSRAVNLSRSGAAVLLVDKFHREAKLLKNGRVAETFQVDLGWNGLNDKLRQGDGATPEGEYKVTKMKRNGDTKYHLALLLNYPNDQDKVNFQRMKKKGLIPKQARIGGLIEIHGEGGRGQDWTDGCLALDNSEMERLFGLSYVGMPVIVVGKCSPGK